MANYDVVGAKPELLIAHGVAKEYTIVGVTPQKFIETHTGLDFNLTELKNEFRKHCMDYMDPVALDKKSYAVEFCSKIVYEVGPESRKVRKGTGDKVWKFIFPVKRLPAGGEVEKHTVFVATYKQETAQFKPDYKERSMIMTLKQAGLIAMDTFSRLVILSFGQGYKLMTPLAGACFSKEDTASLAQDLGMVERDLLVAINQSTQSGGHYLNESDADIAVCASISATRNVKEEGLKKGIINKVIKQYMAKGKNISMARIEKISGYATGGVPVGLSYEELVRTFENAQTRFSAARLAQATRQTIAHVTVHAPGLYDDEAAGPSHLYTHTYIHTRRFGRTMDYAAKNLAQRD